MRRILTIVVAVAMGAALSWLFVPNMLPAASPAIQERAQLKPISMEERRARATRLIGGALPFITDTTVRSVDWFREQGPEAIQNAMDECMLVSDVSLYAEHVRALEAKGAKVELGPLAGPPETQIRTCENVYRAYGDPAGAASSL